MTSISSFVVVVISIYFSTSVYGFQSFSSNRHIHVTPSSRRCRKQYLKTDNDDDNKNKFLDRDDRADELDIETLLDTPIYDPEKSNGWFADLVRNDYNTAEALYAGLIWGDCFARSIAICNVRQWICSFSRRWWQVILICENNLGDKSVTTIQQ